VQLTGATIRSVSRGVIGIARLQAILGGAGFLAAGVPAAGSIVSLEVPRLASHYRSRKGA
jgi:hypothetical protein